MKFALRQVLSETVGDDASASRKTQGKYNCDTLYEVTSIVNFVDTFPKGESKPQREKQEKLEDFAQRLPTGKYNCDSNITLRGKI